MSTPEKIEEGPGKIKRFVQTYSVEIAMIFAFYIVIDLLT